MCKMSEKKRHVVNNMINKNVYSLKEQHFLKRGTCTQFPKAEITRRNNKTSYNLKKIQ